MKHSDKIHWAGFRRLAMQRWEAYGYGRRRARRFARRESRRAQQMTAFFTSLEV
jgi:hypothetical protein